MHLDLLAVVEQENGCAAAPRRPGAREPRAEEPWGTRRYDAHLAGQAHPRITVNLDQHFPFQDAQDLVGVVVAVEVPDVVGRNRLHPHDQTLQPVPRAGDHADIAGSGRDGI